MAFNVGQSVYDVFVKGRVTEFVILLIMVGLIYYYMTLVKKGKTWYIRRVKGIDAIDTALAHATELGGTIHFSPGDQADLKGEYVGQTIAGFECLQYIVAHCAKTKTPLVVGLIGRGGSGGDLVPIASDLVRNAMNTSGWSDGYREGETVRYVSGERTMYPAAIAALYRRENVKSSFLIGPWAGSMLQASALAAGFGVYQVSGTARLWQMPTEACLAKYFMVGEEMFAAGAVLSGDKNVMATLKIGDFAKIALIVTILVGVVLRLAGNTWLNTVLSW